MSLKMRGQLFRRICRANSCRNWVFEALNRCGTRFALPQSETSERSEVRHPIASCLESFHSCWVERLLYNVEKCKAIYAHRLSGWQIIVRLLHGIIKDVGVPVLLWTDSFPVLCSGPLWRDGALAMFCLSPATPNLTNTQKLSWKKESISLWRSAQWVVIMTRPLIRAWWSYKTHFGLTAVFQLRCFMVVQHIGMPSLLSGKQPMRSTTPSCLWRGRGQSGSTITPPLHYHHFASTSLYASRTTIMVARTS